MDKTKIQHFNDNGDVLSEKDVSYWSASNDSPPSICISYELPDGSFWQISLPLDVVSKMVKEAETDSELKKLGLPREI